MAFRDIKTTKTVVPGGSGQVIPVVMPDQVEAGDYLFVFILQNSLNICSTTPPTGWTYLAQQSGGRYYKVADGTEDGTTVNFNALNVGGSSSRAVICFATSYGFSEPVVSIVITDSSNFQKIFDTGFGSPPTTGGTIGQLESTYYRTFISALRGSAHPITTPPYASPWDSYATSNFDADRTGQIDQTDSSAYYTNFSAALLDRVNFPPGPLGGVAQMEADFYGSITDDYINASYIHIVLNFNAPVIKTIEYDLEAVLEGPPPPDAAIASGPYIPVVYERQNWY